MNKLDIQLLCEYNRWANARILGAAADLTEEQYLAPGRFPHSGLRGTLMHTLFAGWVWRMRWQGTAPDYRYRFQPEDFPTVAALHARWTEEDNLLMEFVAALTDEKLQAEFDYTSTEGGRHRRRLWEAMAHMVNHGMQHRSEAAAMLTVPPSSMGRGVLVLHPWWGLNDTIKDVCTQLAEAGFVAYAPDLYHGKLATTIAEAEALSGALDAERARVDVAAAVNFLSERAAPGGLAVIGFSLGAFFALDVSASDPDRIRAVVLFYGTGPGDFTASRAVYQGHFAEADPYEPASYVDDLEASLREAGRPVTFYRYPGVGHWFCEPDRTDAYNPAAAALAWERTRAFLRDALPPEP